MTSNPTPDDSPPGGRADRALLHWLEPAAAGETEMTAHWRSQAGLPPPKRVVIADDTLTGDAAYRLTSQGTALLWRGDFQNARQLLQAIARRFDRAPKKARASPSPAAGVSTLRESFHLHRMARAQRSRTLGMLLIPVAADHSITLRRAPDASVALHSVYGGVDAPYVISLRELLGIVGAFEWQKTGIEVPALGARVHPHYGVFAPVRGEYLALVANAPLPPIANSAASVAFDIGTGTGVLAAILARRGLARIVATDLDPRALVCARENIDRLGLAGQVEVQCADLFPAGRAHLIVCNPPWLPGRPGSPLERAVYDEGSAMLRGFVNGLADHLEARGEGWLILSDLAEHLGLRTHEELLALFARAGLTVVGKTDVRPTHGRASDASDAFHLARAAEVTSLWRLVAAAPDR